MQYPFVQTVALKRRVINTRGDLCSWIFFLGPAIRRGRTAAPRREEKTMDGNQSGCQRQHTRKLTAG